MKRIFSVILFCSLVLSMTNCEWLRWFEQHNNETVFVDIPDRAFLGSLIAAGVDKNGDGKISHREARDVEALHLGGSTFDGTSLHIGENIYCNRSGEIRSLEGIAAFKNLRYLDCSCNQLSVLDLSKNTKLEYLNCVWNDLTSINLTENYELKELICSYNLYESIDLSGNPNLVYLDCSESELKSLDVSQNTSLVHLDCSDQEIPKLDVSNSPDLRSLNCHNNLLTELDLSYNTELIYLWAQQNYFPGIDLSKNDKLVEISLADIAPLGKVCVWTMPFPPNNVSVDIGGSPGAYFTTDCR